MSVQHLVPACLGRHTVFKSEEKNLQIEILSYHFHVGADVRVGALSSSKVLRKSNELCTMPEVNCTFESPEKSIAAAFSSFLRLDASVTKRLVVATDLNHLK